jgi:hypothetical protein
VLISAPALNALLTLDSLLDTLSAVLLDPLLDALPEAELLLAPDTPLLIMDALDAASLAA